MDEKTGFIHTIVSMVQCRQPREPGLGRKKDYTSRPAYNGPAKRAKPLIPPNQRLDYKLPLTNYRCRRKTDCLRNQLKFPLSWRPAKAGATENPHVETSHRQPHPSRRSRTRWTCTSLCHTWTILGKKSKGTWTVANKLLRTVTSGRYISVATVRPVPATLLLLCQLLSISSYPSIDQTLKPTWILAHSTIREIQHSKHHDNLTSPLTAHIFTRLNVNPSLKSIGADLQPLQW